MHDELFDDIENFLIEEGSAKTDKYIYGMDFSEVTCPLVALQNKSISLKKDINSYPTYSSWLIDVLVNEDDGPLINLNSFFMEAINPLIQETVSKQFSESKTDIKELCNSQENIKTRG